MRVIVLGSGPGGTAAVLRARTLGDAVTVVDPGPVGGHALHNSLVPSKSLIVASSLVREVRGPDTLGDPAPRLWAALVHRQRERARQLAEATRRALAGCTVIQAAARPLVDGGRVGAALSTGDTVFGDALIIAVGSVQRPVPGLTPDGKTVLIPRHLALIESPPEALTVIGAGPTGLEVATLFQRAGTAVTLLTPHDRLLPDFDPVIGQAVTALLERLGVRVRTGVRVMAGQVEDGVVHLKTPSGEIEAPRVFLATGRVPVFDADTLRAVPLAVDAHGFIAVDPATGRTSHPGIWAAGDATGTPLLANKARVEGRRAVDDAHGLLPADRRPPVLVDAIYTHPDVARVGETPGRGATGLQRIAAEAGPLTYRLWLDHDFEVPPRLILYTDSDHRIRGGEAFGPSAASILAPVALAVQAELGLDDLLAGGFASPTMEEWLYDLDLRS